MINLDRNFYPYLEEINEGVERQFQPLPPGQTKRILDVGCGQGQLGEAIQEKAYEVWGIEANQYAVDAAARRLHRVILSDLHDHDRVRDGLDGAKFDSLIFSDVLEHTYDPLKVLKAYLKYVRPGGSVVISVPNALVWEFRFQYLFGKFDYQDTGVLDRTHIRFFTFKTARKLVEAAGCKITIVDSTPYIVRALLPVIKRVVFKQKGADESTADRPENPRTIIDSKSYRFYQKWIYPAEYRVASLWKGMFAFRIIIVGIKVG
jgi:2-polyprenyl-3-methyl-5-hydroxy-6-metoxy-1,4-benzoquinol methylase